MSAENPFAAPGASEDAEFELYAERLRAVARIYWLQPICLVVVLLFLAGIAVLAQSMFQPTPMLESVLVAVGAIGVAGWLAGIFVPAIVMARLVHPLVGLVAGLAGVYPMFTVVPILFTWWYSARRLKLAGYRVGWFTAQPPITEESL